MQGWTGRVARAERNPSPEACLARALPAPRPFLRLLTLCPRGQLWPTGSVGALAYTIAY